MLKNYFWLANVFLVTVMAIQAGGFAKTYLSTRLMAPVVSEQIQVGGPSGPLTQAAPLTQFEIITERNIFNANPPSATTTASVPVAPPLVAPEPEVQITQLQLKLVGIVAGNGVQRYAIIEEAASRGVQALYHIGDTIQQVPIVDIRPDCVVFDVRGTHEVLCFQYDSETAGASSRPTATTPASTDVGEGETSSDGIVRVDQGTWRVSRELIMENFANLGSLSSQARVVPYTVQGATNGFRLTRLKGGSLLQQIGLQNGDVLQRVNGLSIHSPQEALQAYQALQNEGTVRLEILRHNRATTLTYEIR